MIPAVIYIRLDTPRSAPEQILSHQIDQLFFCAKKYQWEITGQFQDIGYSISCPERPGFHSMLRWMERENIFLVLTPTVSHIQKIPFFSQFTLTSRYFYSLKEKIFLPLPTEVSYQ